MRGVTSLVGLGAGLACFGLAAQTSSADTTLGSANGVTYVKDQQEITPGQPAAPTADCPPGTRLLGAAGDAVTTQLDGILSGIRPEDSFADDDLRPDDGATAFGFNPTNVTANTDVWVFCGTGKMRYPSRSTRIDLETTRSIKVPCGEGTRVLSGGFTAEGGNNHTFLNAMRPFDDGDANARPDDGWQVRVTNVAGFDDKRYTAWAFCRPNLQVLYPDLDNLGGVGGNNMAGTGKGCPDQGVSLVGAGGEIRGAPLKRRVTAIRPDDNTLVSEPDTVPDDGLVAEVRNDAARGAATGPHPICAELIN